jgi:hypothetical protein
MLDEKLCITVGHRRMMCRIDPELHERAMQKKGARMVKESNYRNQGGDG